MLNRGRKIEMRKAANPLPCGEMNGELDFESCSSRLKTIRCAEAASNMDRDSVMLVLGLTYVQSGCDIATMDIRVLDSASYDSEDDYGDSGDEFEVVTEDGIAPVRSQPHYSDKRHS